jgi:hypothetical protein
MRTKEVLFHTRTQGWGMDTDLYCSKEDCASDCHLAFYAVANWC